MKEKVLEEYFNYFGESKGLSFKAKNSAFGFEYFQVYFNGKYAGLIDAREDSKEIRINSINLNERGKGFGKKIFSVIKEYSDSAGITEISINKIFEDDNRLRKSDRIKIFDKIGTDLGFKVILEDNNVIYKR